MSEASPNRRQFLRAGAATVLALGAGGCASPTGGDDSGNVLNALDEQGRTKTLVDQYDRPFNAKAALGGKPFILVFGFSGCDQCEHISSTLAVVQQTLKDNGRNVPIVVLSTNPSADRDILPQYTAHYAEKGLRQSAGEPAGQPALAAYEATRHLPSRERLFHVLCTGSQQETYDIHDKKLNLMRNPNESNGHDGRLLVCDGEGRQIDEPLFAALRDPADQLALAIKVADRLPPQTQLRAAGS